MTVCLDTNVVLRIFTATPPFPFLLRRLLDGHITLAISNEILFEYREVTTSLYGTDTWEDTNRLLLGLERLGFVVNVSPSFRFALISSDPDDNKFADCAIAANAQFIVSSDRHFTVVNTAGYQCRAIDPLEFARLLGRS